MFLHNNRNIHHLYFNCIVFLFAFEHQQKYGNALTTVEDEAECNARLGGDEKEEFLSRLRCWKLKTEDAKVQREIIEREITR